MDALPPGQPVYERDLDLPPRKQKGWVHELEVPMHEGEDLDYEAVHDEPGGRIAFNIHSHQGAEVSYYARSSAARVSGAFTAPWDGKFYLMWENVSGEAVRLHIRASRR